MKKYYIEGNTYHIKNDLKKILPNKCRARWKFNQADRSWTLDLLEKEATKTFTNKIKGFCAFEGLTLTIINVKKNPYGNYKKDIHNTRQKGRPRQDGRD